MADSLLHCCLLQPFSCLPAPCRALQPPIAWLLWLGCSLVQMGALTTILSYWVVAVPLAYYLAFPCGLGLAGLWWGSAVANTGQGLLMLAIALCFDFEGEAVQASAAFDLRQSLLRGEVA